ncbi:DNA-binding transcriptional LysR family regulator [Amycolatopsis bartoniae]|uniref:LysR family transcriptional regulator n=1 Tax=Amycolatopsis bartoniae TaxID=941986 RepID=A0A8H9J1L0_9PSEU|nr:LysR family transcriptional regulator [Amycolatopsis bartoniae]MBB2938701.1 DNA-binding transcriptional LysR family regulator [Amycolatopsis bartoniae]TVT11514.1 LysR family transcriptional regulator [Amycolatopsis bartoniae]GHF79533.1 LysR family transcriptional regulator [Amycolatopsis bartoniae]
MPEQLDLNLLRVFDALLREGSVTAAAERLHLSIPATSRALGRLRRAMADPILVRAGRGMAPTPFALRTAPRVRSLLDEASALISADREITVGELERTFTIRINDGVAATLAATAVEAVAAAAPGVTLRFVAEGNESTEALRDGSVDLDIGAGEPAAPDLRTAELYRERLVGIVRADSPLGRHRRPTLAQLCRYPHVSASRRGRARGPLDEILEAEGLRRHVAAVVPTSAVAALLVASSPYVGLVPQRLAEQYGETLGIRWFPLAADLPVVEVRLSWHVRLDADPAHRWLRDTIREALKA